MLKESECHLPFEVSRDDTGFFQQDLVAQGAEENGSFEQVSTIKIQQ
jgi:hypothetical protein